MRKILLWIAVAGCLACLGSCTKGSMTAISDESKVVIAYVTSWSEPMPDPAMMTHINYAFGHVADSFDSLRIDNVDRLRQIVALKNENPSLRVLVSVGGWGSGNFSEMAADSALRASFVSSCKKAVDDYGLDGIDIDWEYPTSSAAGISSSPEDTENFTLLIKDLRTVLDDDALLSIATVANAKYIDFPAVVPYLDYVNTMTYDMANPPYHHASLYNSAIAPYGCVSNGVEAHLAAGVPKEKLVMGMPLYHRGHREVLDDPNVIIAWDDTAKVPYAVMCDTLALGMENEKSIECKCQYIIDQDLAGGMYWEYCSEKDPERPLVHKVHDMMIGTAK